MADQVTDYYFLSTEGMAWPEDHLPRCAMPHQLGESAYVVVILTDPDEEGNFLARFVCYGHLDILLGHKPDYEVK